MTQLHIFLGLLELEHAINVSWKGKKTKEQVAAKDRMQVDVMQSISCYVRLHTKEPLVHY